MAEEGPDVLRSGPLAESLAKDIRDAGGIMQTTDLEAYEPRVLPPLQVQSAMGVGLLGMPPPSSGGAAVAMVLEFLGGYDLPLAAFG